MTRIPDRPAGTIGRVLRTVLAMGIRTAVVAGVAAATTAVGPSSAMAAAGQCADPGQNLTPIPWAQQVLAPERVWPFTKGGGITVAVLDSGVDANHPQLRGHVSDGFDAVTGSGPANNDCLGTGTQVAGVIGAGQTSSAGFFGVSPEVTILPVRVVAARTSGPNVADPQVLARGIDTAVARGATVIVVSTVSYTDSDELRRATTKALAKGVTVVAAVGDLGDPTDANPTPYPARYPDVIGVGAVGRNGERWSKSQHGSYVDLVAPGAEVITLQRGQGMTTVDGTGVAAGFVAATAALVRAKRGGSDLGKVLFSTATPTPGGPEYGHGMVNPYAAVNDQVAKATPADLPALAKPNAHAESGFAQSRDLAVAGTGIALLAVLCVVLAAATLPRGRRRFWRSVTAPKPKTSTEPDEPGPPLLLFEDSQRG